MSVCIAPDILLFIDWILFTERGLARCVTVLTYSTAEQQDVFIEQVDTALVITHQLQLIVQGAGQCFFFQLFFVEPLQKFASLVIFYLMTVISDLIETLCDHENYSRSYSLFARCKIFR